MSDTGPRTPFSGKTRAEDGLLVTFTDGERQRVVARSGARVTRCLAEAIAIAERWPGEWQVAVISSPTTIYRDLQGTRRRPTLTGIVDHARRRRVAHEDFRPERQMLARIGRLDLLAS